MAIGMSYTEFWYDDPYKVRTYYRAYELKRELNNTEMWMQGAYVYNAFCSALGSAFGKSKETYIKKPIEFYPTKKDNEEKKAEEERKKIIAHFSMLKANWDLTHKE